MTLTREQIKKLRAEPATGKNRVRRARERAEMTQVALAQASGLTQAFISAIEIGDYSAMTLDTSRALARALGCTVDDLFPTEREAKAS